MGWGSRCPSDGGRPEASTRRSIIAPFSGEVPEPSPPLGSQGGHQGLDRHPWLGHAREGGLRPPQIERAAAEDRLWGPGPPGAEQSLAGARQAEGRQCLGGAGVKDIHHPRAKPRCYWLLLKDIGGPPPPAPWWAEFLDTVSSETPSHPGTNPSAGGRGATGQSAGGPSRGRGCGARSLGQEGCEGGAWPWEASFHL